MTNMSRPVPESFDPSRLAETARAVMRAGKFPMLATIDGDHPRLRPVSPVRTENFTVYVANLRRYHKTVEIATNPRVELCYVDPGHDQVRISGIAEIVEDRATIEAIWAENPLLRDYLGSPENPELIIYRISPTRVRFMKEWALEYHEVPADEYRRP